MATGDGISASSLFTIATIDFGCASHILRDDGIRKTNDENEFAVNSADSVFPMIRKEVKTLVKAGHPIHSVN
jgi:hypothetical protein